MTIRNRVENGIIIAITMIVTVVVFSLHNHFFVMKPILKELSETRKVVERIALKDTYSIKNEFEKMRTKKNGSIVLDLNNDLTHNEMNLVPMATLQIDSIDTRKKNWFSRFFSKRQKHLLPLVSD